LYVFYYFHAKLRYEVVTGTDALLNPLIHKLNLNNVLKELVFKENILLKLDCLHPIACTRSGSGFPSNATLFQ
jgi:hypothetical protein